jgi:hypothetical protein
MGVHAPKAPDMELEAATPPALFALAFCTHPNPRPFPHRGGRGLLSYLHAAANRWMRVQASSRIDSLVA